MNRLLIIFAVLAGLIAGCGIASREIKMKSESKRTDVFSEVREGMPPKGFADLAIKASIKSHLEGYYLYESKSSLHGKQVYPFLLNVDGQAVVWEVEGEKEDTPARDERGRRTPEVSRRPYPDRHWNKDTCGTPGLSKSTGRIPAVVRIKNKKNMLLSLI